MQKEKTLVLIKPDAIKRGIFGKILTRFEDAGFKIVAMKMLQIDEKFAKNHYILEEEWAKKSYAKTKEIHDKIGHKLAFKDHMDYGRTIQQWNANVLIDGPLIAFILQGAHAVEMVRKMIGPTEPRQAQPGTIRGDFITVESYAVADAKQRAIKTLVHASDSVENAKREINLWFKPKEICADYKILNDYLLE
jgi:nucleoside-diphosphate kinase